MGLNLNNARLIGSQLGTGEVWMDDDGRLVFIPYSREFREELVEQSGDVAVTVLETLAQWRDRMEK